MLKKTKKGFYVLKEFGRRSGIVHGFSSRQFGDCNSTNEKNRKNIEEFLVAVGLKKKILVMMEQIHANRIKVVFGKDRGKTIPGVDGILTKDRKVALTIRTADCLPILFYDPVGKIVGVAHAGWRGVLTKLPQKMVEMMIRLGSLPKNIKIGVGPYIGGCCYNIETQRATSFINGFNSPEGMLLKKKNKIYLELTVPMVLQLIHTGVLKRNIFTSSSCTSCQNNDFYSYRKNSKDTYGEMLAVIALA